MTTYTDNLSVPHLDQNVAQPEIPENVAKDIFDSIFAGKYTTDFPSNDDYIYPFTQDPIQATNWHNFVQDFTDDLFPLTAVRTVTFPVYNRPYLLINNTDQTLNFEITGQVTPITLANGGTNMYCYSDGTNLIKFEFASDTTTLIALTDTPSVYDINKILRSTAAGTEWYDIVTDLATKLNHTSGTATTITLSGTTTNSGTIDGGISLDTELKDFGITEQTVTSTTNAMTIDLASGNHVYYAAIETTTITITSSSHASSILRILMNDAGTYGPTWPATVKWPANVEPTWTTGDDYIELVMINSIWVMSNVSLDVRSA